MNQLKMGSRVFSIRSSDGKAKPEYYWLEEEGIVQRIKNTSDMKLIDWGKFARFDCDEKMFLKPSSDGFCYYMAELSDMDKYKDGDYYKIPTKILKEHMKTYISPWK